MAKRSSEPFWWSLFAAGGGASAMLLPITIVLTGIALPFGWVTPETLYRLIHHPLGRLYLFALISLSLFHAAHRIFFTLLDVGLKEMRGPLGILLHGVAIVGTALAALFLLRM